jgi:MYXO-CTERM domain-containing protein
MRVYVLVLMLGAAADAHAIGICITDADCAGGVCAASCVKGLCLNSPSSKKGMLCRPTSGACDRPEFCDGFSADCPGDAVLPAGTVCRAAVNDCDVAEKCSGRSKDCPADSIAPPGTACENVSACISGGTCAGPVCIGGQPELTFAPDPADFPQGVREIDVLVQHTGPGAPIEVSGARIDSAGAFVITSAPAFPAPLASGEQVHLTVRLDPNVTPGDHAASLLLQATSCADQPLHLHAAVTDPGPGTPDAGSGSPDAGTPAPDAGSPAPGAGSGPVGSSGSSSTDPGKGGGCSSGPAPVEALALAGLAAASLRRRRRPAA